MTIVGVVTGKQSPGTAAGITFLTLEDDTGNINVIVWQATARSSEESLSNSQGYDDKRGIRERRTNHTCDRRKAY